MNAIFWYKWWNGKNNKRKLWGIPGTRKCFFSWLAEAQQMHFLSINGQIKALRQTCSKFFETSTAVFLFSQLLWIILLPTFRCLLRLVRLDRLINLDHLGICKTALHKQKNPQIQFAPRYKVRKSQMCTVVSWSHQILKHQQLEQRWVFINIRRICSYIF